MTINLDKPLPEKLAGRAGFNLEFLPSIYMEQKLTWWTGAKQEFFRERQTIRW